MTKRRIRAMFFDVDGTLISFEDKRLPPSARRALLEAHACGVHLFVATGRHLHSLHGLKQLEGLPFAGYVTMNGQYCIRGDALVHHVPLERDDVRRIVRALDEEPVTAVFQAADTIFANQRDDAMRAMQRASGVPIPPVCDSALALEREIYQVTLYIPDGRLPAVTQQLQHSTCVRWHRNCVDVIPREGGKGIAVERMLACFSIPPEETAAFGDGENDIDMLRTVGVGIAMGNARDKVKAAADFVTDRVEDDGVANAMQRLRYC